MRIGIVGAGRIGGGAARLFVAAGHDVLLSFSHDRSALDQFARELVLHASTGTPREAVAFGEVIIFSVPRDVIPQALAETGALQGKIVVDTTNQFGTGPMPSARQTAAQFNAARMPGARYTKSFNTLTAAFQAQAARRSASQRVVQWIAGDDAEAKQMVARLIDDVGFQPVDVGSIAECAVMEAPRRSGAVYGEEYRLSDAQAVRAHR